jgi:hypothetical protein
VNQDGIVVFGRDQTKRLLDVVSLYNFGLRKNTSQRPHNEQSHFFKRIDYQKSSARVHFARDKDRGHATDPRFR